MPPVPTRLLLVRHGESTWNAEHRWQGWADPPLSDQGRADAEVLAETVVGLGFGTVASSDLRRAAETAAILVRRLGLTPIVDRDLRERDVGDWSGHTSEEIDRRWPGMVSAWRQGVIANPPNGETNEVFLARVLAALARVVAGCSGTLLVVTHGGVIRILERHGGAVDAHPPPNLGGRWFDWSSGEGLVARDPFIP